MVWKTVGHDDGDDDDDGAADRMVELVVVLDVDGASWRVRLDGQWV